MEENNRKGPSTFYAVVGVATLVVAIIGATFAFFSASQTNSDITGNTAEAGGLTISVLPITDKTNNNIIPLNLITNQTLKSGSETEYVDSVDQFEKAMQKKCKDDLGNNICTVYKVVVSNQSKTSTIRVQGKLNLDSKTENMYWTLVNATTTTTPGEGETTVELLNTATAKADFAKVKQGKDGFITYSAETDETTGINKADSVSLTGTDGDNSSATYYVLVWLEEIGTEQQDEDASKTDSIKTYTGNITFDAVDAQGNKSGVTATFLS